MFLTLEPKGDGSSLQMLYRYGRDDKAFVSQWTPESVHGDPELKKTQLTNEYLVLYRVRENMGKWDLRSKGSFVSLMSN